MINTHEAVKRLTRAGFSEAQAEALVHVMVDYHSESSYAKPMDLSIEKLKCDLLWWQCVITILLGAFLASIKFFS